MLLTRWGLFERKKASQGADNDQDSQFATCEIRQLQVTQYTPRYPSYSHFDNVLFHFPLHRARTKCLCLLTPVYNFILLKEIWESAEYRSNSKNREGARKIVNSGAQSRFWALSATFGAMTGSSVFLSVHIAPKAPSSAPKDYPDYRCYSRGRHSTKGFYSS